MSAKFWTDGNVRRQRIDRERDTFRAKDKRRRHLAENHAAIVAEVFAVKEAQRRGLTT